MASQKKKAKKYSQVIPANKHTGVKQFISAYQPKEEDVKIMSTNFLYRSNLSQEIF